MSEPVYNMIGYGTFMTQSLHEFDGSMDSSTYGVDIKLVKPVLVKGYRRVSTGRDFPYAIKDEECEFWGLAFQVTGDYNLKRLDRVEGVPYHYTREEIEVDGKKYFIYIASKSTQENIKHHIREIPKDKDYWYTRVYMAIMGNELLVNHSKFRPLQNIDLCEQEIFDRYDWEVRDDE